MGIPYFFKHLTMKYPHILDRIPPNQVLHLFLDSNSIVYDAVRHLETDPAHQGKYLTDDEIIDQTLKRIEQYILDLKPSQTLFIAFDGVAPLAKMNQQRTRRHKHLFSPHFPQTEARPETNPPKRDCWDTTVITPGTPFMKSLSTRVKKAFLRQEQKYHIQRILVSTAEEVGEGEHKLFEWLRKNSHKLGLENDDLYVYGMDADLIMLSLLHLPYTRNIRVFREYENRQGKSNTTKKTVVPKEETLYIHIRELALSIQREMMGSSSSSSSSSLNEVFLKDYIFLCFFLGNDFMPHFPSMNIRTHGLPTLLDVYNQLSKKRFFSFFDRNGRIQWTSVESFIRECTKHEHEWLIQEYVARDKMASSVRINQTTEKDRMEALDNVPILFRMEEFYISPQIPGWRERYYECLFHKGTDPKIICRNYLEGLEWTWQYYSAGCSDWRWMYPYHYAPLWTDLARYFGDNLVKSVDKTFTLKPSLPFTAEEQLDFVMPKPNTVITGAHFQWAFCRYFWESHLVLEKNVV